MLIRLLDFFLIRDRPFDFFFFVEGGGVAGADFCQQLKLDIFRDFSECIYFLTIKKSFLQLLLIAAIRLNINKVYILQAIFKNYYKKGSLPQEIIACG